MNERQRIEKILSNQSITRSEKARLIYEKILEPCIQKTRVAQKALQLATRQLVKRGCVNCTNYPQCKGNCEVAWTILAQRKQKVKVKTLRNPTLAVTVLDLEAK